MTAWRWRVGTRAGSLWHRLHCGLVGRSRNSARIPGLQGRHGRQSGHIRCFALIHRHTDIFPAVPAHRHHKSVGIRVVSVCICIEESV